jgi:hypothetical protein
MFAVPAKILEGLNKTRRLILFVFSSFGDMPLANHLGKPYRHEAYGSSVFLGGI